MQYKIIHANLIIRFKLKNVYLLCSKTNNDLTPSNYESHGGRNYEFNKKKN